MKPTTPIEDKLSVATQIQTVVDFLATAKIHDFIAGAEAAGIFKEILRETGYKTVKPFVKPEAAAHKEVKD